MKVFLIMVIEIEWIKKAHEITCWFVEYGYFQELYFCPVDYTKDCEYGESRSWIISDCAFALGHVDDIWHEIAHLKDSGDIEDLEKMWNFTYPEELYDTETMADSLEPIMKKCYDNKIPFDSWVRDYLALEPLHLRVRK